MIFAETAPAYFERGIPVMPLVGKRAIITGWPSFGSEAAPSRELHEQWLRNYATNNIGLIFGPISGIAAIDIDDPEVMDLVTSALPASPCLRIGSKGGQIYFKAPAGLQSFKLKNQETGKTLVECLYTGNQGVLAPSIHPDTGKPYTSNVPLYEVLDQLPMLSLDVENILREVLRLPTRVVSAQPTGSGAKVQEGGRHVAACSYIGRLVEAGVSGHDLRLMAESWNSEYCEPPLDTSELHQILKSAEDKWVAKATLPMTDVGNGHRLTKRLKGKALFVTEWQDWAVYNEGRWQRDLSGGMVRHQAQLVGAELLASTDDALRKWGHQSQNITRIEAMVKTARSIPGMAISAAKFDLDPDLLNTPDGIWDLRTGERLPNAPEQHMTLSTAVAADPAMPTPHFDAFLLSTFAEAPEKAEFLKRWIGYCLTGRVSERAFLVASGAGKNGKSLALNVIGDILGSYATVISMQALMQSRFITGPQPEIAELKGKRFAAASEGNEGQRLNAALVKNLTGMEPIKARRLNENPIQFTPQVKITLATNFPPDIDGSDQAVIDRLKYLTFNQIFDEDRCDPLLGEKLKSEYPGILAKAIQWATEWYQNGLQIPECMTKALARYRGEMDSIGVFIEDCCETGHDVRAPLGVLYDAYLDHARAYGAAVKTRRAFSQELTKRGFGDYRKASARYKTGITLRVGASLWSKIA